MSKSVAEKLLIKPGASIWVSDPEKRGLLEPLPDGAHYAEDLHGAGVAVLFVDSEAAARRVLDEHGAKLHEVGFLWFCYPKGNRADINRDSLWPLVAKVGLRPITQVAVDEVWSALRFRPLKEGEGQFAGGR